MRESIVLLAVTGRGEAVSVLAYRVDIASVSDVRLDTVQVMSANGLHTISKHLSLYALLFRVSATLPVYFTNQDIGKVCCCFCFVALPLIIIVMAHYHSDHIGARKYYSFDIAEYHESVGLLFARVPLT